MPFLLVVVGVVTWRVAAKALSPVDAIRAEVDAISSRDLHRRVSDPSGDDELSRLAATMNRMLERLEAGRLRERSFVSDASHELRSPVATIRQYAEVALSHPDQTDTSELAEIVLDEDARLQRLVEDLLLLTRIDEGTLALRTEPSTSTTSCSRRPTVSVARQNSDRYPAASRRVGYRAIECSSNG